MKFLVAFMLFALLVSTSSCTPLVVGSAAAGGAYVGYKLGQEGYSIKITKPVKGTKPESSQSQVNK